MVHYSSELCIWYQPHLFWMESEYCLSEATESVGECTFQGSANICYPPSPTKGFMVMKKINESRKAALFALNLFKQRAKVIPPMPMWNNHLHFNFSRNKHTYTWGSDCTKKCPKTELFGMEGESRNQMLSLIHTTKAYVPVNEIELTKGRGIEF